MLDISGISMGFAGVRKSRPRSNHGATHKEYYRPEVYFDQGNNVKLHILRTGKYMTLSLFSANRVTGTRGSPGNKVSIVAMLKALESAVIAKTNVISINGKKYKVTKMAELRKILV